MPAGQGAQFATGSLGSGTIKLSLVVLNVPREPCDPALQPRQRPGGYWINEAVKRVPEPTGLGKGAG